jgi:hypothetical protein
MEAQITKLTIIFMNNTFTHRLLYPRENIFIRKNTISLFITTILIFFYIFS